MIISEFKRNRFFSALLLFSLFTFLSISLSLQSIISSNFTDNGLLNINEHDAEDLNENYVLMGPSSSGYWENTSISIDPLAVTNTTDSGNWLWAVSQPWCSGYGTYEQPYIIENMTLNPTAGNHGLSINNSETVYFKIVNCTVKGTTSGYAGIYIQNCSNGIIYDSNCSQNDIGVYINFHCSSITINKSTFNENTFGILLHGEEFYGMVTIERAIYESTIIDNELIDNEVGIYINGSVVDCLFSKNTIEDSLATGLLLHMASQTILFFEVDFYPYNNHIYNNSFTGNAENALMEYGGMGGNEFNNSEIGNYWDDYSGNDYDDNGIGDTPYTYGLITDYLPIFTDGANQLPIITTDEDTVFFQHTLLDALLPDWEINWTVSDPNNLTTSYSILKNDTLVQIGSWESGQPIFYNFTDRPTGIHEMTLEVNDGCTEENVSKTIIVTINDLPLIVESPDGGEYTQGKAYDSFYWTIEDEVTKGASYEIYVNETLVDSGVWISGTPIYLDISGLDLGEYLISIYINDGYVDAPILSAIPIEIVQPANEPFIPMGFSFLIVMIGIISCITLVTKKKLKL